MEAQNDDLVDEIIRNLVESDELNFTPTEIKILKHIKYKTLIKKEKVSEMDIAYAIFAKSENYSPKFDTSIRVHISHIRKKLANYYQNTGASNEYIVIIPKGSYHLSIQKNADRIINRTIKSEYNYYQLAITVLLIILVIQGVYIFIIKHKKPLDDSKVSINNYFWEEFIQNSKPNLIVFHDIFFYNKTNPDKNERYIIYNEDVDSKIELDSLKQHDDSDYEYSVSFDYVRYRSLQQLMDIYPVLTGSGKSVGVKLLSELNPNDLKEYNIIFIGKHRKMGVFEKSLKKLGYSFSFFPHKIIYTPPQSDTSYYYMKKGAWQDFHSDYCIITKFHGPQNNSIALLTSLHAVGNGLTQVVKLVSEPTNLKIFENELPDGIMSGSFTALIKVSGYQETGFSYEIMHSNKVSDTIDLWFE